MSSIMYTEIIDNLNSRIDILNSSLHNYGDCSKGVVKDIIDNLERTRDMFAGMKRPTLTVIEFLFCDILALSKIAVLQNNLLRESTEAKFFEDNKRFFDAMINIFLKSGTFRYIYDFMKSKISYTFDENNNINVQITFEKIPDRAREMSFELLFKKHNPTRAQKIIFKRSMNEFHTNGNFTIKYPEIFSGEFHGNIFELFLVTESKVSDNYHDLRKTFKLER